MCPHSLWCLDHRAYRRVRLGNQNSLTTFSCSIRGKHTKGTRNKITQRGKRPKLSEEEIQYYLKFSLDQRSRLFFLKWVFLEASEDTPGLLEAKSLLLIAQSIFLRPQEADLHLRQRDGKEAWAGDAPSSVQIGLTLGMERSPGV